MKIVKVTYTTTAAYVAQNRANIEVVMHDLQALNIPGINYNTCLGPDEKTFIHTAFFQSEEDQKILFNLASFQHFQSALKASGPEEGPKQELLTLVGSSKPLFN